MLCVHIGLFSFSLSSFTEFSLYKLALVALTYTYILYKYCVFNSETNWLSLFFSMAAANAGRIDYTQPGPIDDSVLSQQAKHRSEAIWNGRVKHNTKYLLLHMHLIHTMYT